MIYSLEDKIPQLNGKNYYVAHNATLIGSVILEDEVGIWFNAVLRGDNDTIHIGKGSNIQDGVILHTDVGAPLVIGERTTVGHGAILHSCNIGDYTLIGIGAIVLNKATIGKYCIIGANTLVPEDMVIPDNSLVLGTPGKVIRKVTEKDIFQLEDSAVHYIKKLYLYKKSFKPV